ncbi:hypothetical protein CHLNCDRAFT_20762 [Chlorella variabilis]|uniref:Serine/threonine-protein phosphatase n=1 Tax=Chlorella variabilis TaxID=554065 RepID=E1Z774_CHLVA|nr:hypothetical protein CHLNCDRAFT_20762 [Chlorella variabilis]EFN58373.1 hypothetical protein CHLNCDRAFT_20762 [Chlorella variabilis]|eukprot:XP_005850475.1 hypothetical protein CHLNCDRAFT_20762 [Chlorella variabilis]
MPTWGIQVVPPPEGQVVVVGDTHGQYHDVCRMLEVVGSPAAGCMYVFNGDFVDRGAWGLETLVLLASWKLALPQQVFLLRGNHESATCTLAYGFKGELVAKYGKSHWRPVYAACKRLFSSLPLAAKIGQQTLVVHGGLFRRQPQRGVGKNKRKRAHPLLYGLDDVTLGTLEDLARATKGGMDPNGLGASRLASDVLWSDPVGDPGFQPNVARGVGMCFGPDITERFLNQNGLRLVLRSHEGPDAREGRDDMQPMSGGYTLDHDTPAGKLMTVFRHAMGLRNAPDYPQFMPEEAERYNNLAAVAVLMAPDWATPTMRQFAAAHPRPEAQPYYDLYVPDSDEEFEPAASSASGMTDVERPSASTMSVASGAGTSQQPPLQQLPTAEADSMEAAGAAATPAAQETSSKSEETAVVAMAEAVGEGSSRSRPPIQPIRVAAHLQHGAASAARGGKRVREAAAVANLAAEPPCPPV